MTGSRLPTALAAAPGAATVHRGAPPRDLTVLTAACDAAGVAWTSDARALDEHARDWWPVSMG